MNNNNNLPPTHKQIQPNNFIPNQSLFQQQQHQAFPYQMQQQAYSYPVQQQMPQMNVYSNYAPPLFNQVYSGHIYSESYNYAYEEALKPQETPIETEEPTLTKDQVESAIKLSLRLKKKTLQSSSFTEQALPMLVSLSVDNIKSTKKAPLDLVCVIDHSGSMQAEKITLVRNTFQYLLQYLSDFDRLSIVIFDHTASRLSPLIRTTQENKDKIPQHVSTITECGSTDIALGMKHAFEILKQRRERNPLSSIFLLSDGLDGGAQYKVSQELERAGEDLKDTTINTFGFGNDHDPQLVTDIAALRDGNFFFIQKLDTVDEAFVDCLGGLLSCVGQNVIIKIKPEQSQRLNGVKFTQAFGEASMWNKDGDMYITKIANLISGKQRDFVLEIKIPVNKKELQDNEKSMIITSAEADITGLDGQHIVKKAELTITLLNELEEVKDEEEDDREVMKNFYRVKGAELLSKADKLAYQGKNGEAKKKLQNFKEELSNSFLKEEQFIKNLIKDIDQAIVNVSPHVYAQSGKHSLMENARAQIYQMSNLQSANGYQNFCQTNVKKKKKNF